MMGTFSSLEKAMVIGEGVPWSVVSKSDDSQGPQGSANKLMVIIEQLIFIKPLLPARHDAKGLIYIISFNLHTIPVRYLPSLSHLQI